MLGFLNWVFIKLIILFFKSSKYLTWHIKIIVIVTPIGPAGQNAEMAILKMNEFSLIGQQRKLGRSKDEIWHSFKTSLADF